MKLAGQLVDSKGHDIYSIGPTSSVFDAIKLMAEKSVGALLVMVDGKLEGIVTERDYASRELATVLGEWLEERRASLAWLRGLEAPDWERAHAHASFGPLHAGDLLASWAAHDALHLRQLAQRLHQQATSAAAPFSPRYAGPWG